MRDKLIRLSMASTYRSPRFQMWMPDSGSITFVEFLMTMTLKITNASRGRDSLTSSLCRDGTGKFPFKLATLAQRSNMLKAT